MTTKQTPFNDKNYIALRNWCDTIAGVQSIKYPSISNIKAQVLDFTAQFYGYKGWADLEKLTSKYRDSKLELDFEQELEMKQSIANKIAVKNDLPYEGILELLLNPISLENTVGKHLDKTVFSNVPQKKRIRQVIISNQSCLNKAAKKGQPVAPAIEPVLVANGISTCDFQTRKYVGWLIKELLLQYGWIKLNLKQISKKGKGKKVGSLTSAHCFKHPLLDTE